MFKNIPPLLAIRYFESAARNLSFTQAAKELFVTQGAISLQIRKLEDHLNTPLFIRRTRQIELTPEGYALYKACNEAFKIMDTATTKIIEPAGQQSITVNTIPTIATLWLLPRLAAFSSIHPHIDVRIISDLRAVDMHEQDIDVALRVGRLPGKKYDQKAPNIDLILSERWDNIDVDFLFPDILIPVVSQNLMSRYGEITHPEELLTFPLIHTATRENAWPDWFGAHNTIYKPTKTSFEVGHFYIALKAAQESQGIALIPEILFREYPGRNELTPILQHLPVIQSAGGYYLLTKKQTYKKDATDAFRQWVLNEVAKNSKVTATIKEMD